MTLPRQRREELLLIIAYMQQIFLKNNYCFFYCLITLLRLNTWKINYNLFFFANFDFY